MGNRTKIANTNDLNPGDCRVVEVGGKPLALFNVDGTFYALDNTCLHRGGPLGEGELDGRIVTCPWHGWQYDVTTGANANNPSVKVACVPVTVEGASVFVEE
jgi:nitrite reductase/ring-hydroxylating ferredoxin subunit